MIKVVIILALSKIIVDIGKEVIRNSKNGENNNEDTNR